MWSNVDTVEELFMSAADGNSKSVSSLLEGLSSAPAGLSNWAKSAKDAWLGGLELALDSWDRTTLLPKQQELVFRMAELGFDLLTLRDSLAAMARKEFSAYLDPAGILEALCIQETHVTAAEICRRWHTFAAVGKDVWSASPAHGAGRILEIDEFANEVHVSLDRHLHFPLDVFIGTFACVRKDTILDTYLDTGKVPKGAPSGAELWAEALASVATVSVSPEKAVALLTASQGYSTDDLGCSKQKKKKGTAKASGTATTEGAKEEGKQRQWYHARSLAELVDLLKGIEGESEIPDDLSGFEQIMTQAAGRKDLATKYAEALTRIWATFPVADPFTAILKPLGETAVCWQMPELFVEITDGMTGRLVSSWVRATSDIVGPEFLADICMTLPARLWSHVEQSLDRDEATRTFLLDRVMRGMKDDTVSPDGLLWLYRSKCAERETLSNVTLLFKVLNRPVKGSFIKANRDLHRLLMENETFQKLLMRNGEQRSIENLVRSVKHLPLLDSGERQSLLVKIVRIYPDSRPLVEEKQQPTRKAVGRLTAARNFELRRQELEDITNRRIPANSRAIAHARSYGDLRENAEFKAAKEEQRFLTARRDELEDDLHDIKATDFRDVQVNDVVIPGCEITLTLSTGDTVVYCLLGLWDSVPEKHYVSYDTPMGKVFLGAKIGDRVVLPNGDSAEISALSALADDVLEWVGDVDVFYVAE